MAVETLDTPKGQIRVETGSGVIAELVRDAGKRNAQVKFRATHTALREPVTAWVDTHDAALWPIVEASHAEGLELDYRIEVHRKATVDATKPIAEVNSRDKVRNLAAVFRKGTQQQTVPASPPAAQPSTPSPPAASSRSEASGEPGEPACAVCGVATFADQRAAIDHANSLPHQAAVQRARKQAAVDLAATFDDGAGHRDRPVPPPAKRGPRIEEGRPWELYNTDGSLNLASYSYTAVVGFVELAHDLISRRVADVQGDTGEAPELRLSQVESLARMLLDAADRCQASNRQDGRVDRMDASHTRARGAVRTALKVYPVPWNVSSEVRTEWLDNLATHAAALMRIAFDLFRLQETGTGQ